MVAQATADESSAIYAAELTHEVSISFCGQAKQAAAAMRCTSSRDAHLCRITTGTAADQRSKITSRQFRTADGVTEPLEFGTVDCCCRCRRLTAAWLGASIASSPTAGNGCCTQCWPGAIGSTLFPMRRRVLQTPDQLSLTAGVVSSGGVTPTATAVHR